jgi:alkanesulfonate monooxygenase
MGTISYRSIGGRRSELISPPAGRHRVGAPDPAPIVGSPDTMVKTPAAYQAADVDTFILSGMPLLEEASRVAETVLPRLPVNRELPRAMGFT